MKNSFLFFKFFSPYFLHFYYIIFFVFVQHFLLIFDFIFCVKLILYKFKFKRRSLDLLLINSFHFFVFILSITTGIIRLCSSISITGIIITVSVMASTLHNSVSPTISFCIPFVIITCDFFNYFSFLFSTLFFFFSTTELAI